MKCACGNAGRYINARAELCCGTCPIREGIDSIRISDIPALLQFLRVEIDLEAPTRANKERLAELIGRMPPSLAMLFGRDREETMSIGPSPLDRNLEAFLDDPFGDGK